MPHHPTPPSPPLSSLGPRLSQLSRKLQTLDEFLRQNRVPPSICNRMREFFNYTTKRSLHKDESRILGGELRAPAADTASC